MNFAVLGLSPPLLAALESLDYRLPTSIQDQAIPPVITGRDLLAVAQTGTGKTAGFALPILECLSREADPVSSNSVRALVLVPTRELAEQVHESFRAYGKYLSLRTYAVYGGVSINPQMMKMRRGVDVVVATPGRLLDLHRQNAIRFGQVRVLVLDEADRMLDLGFSKEIDAVMAALPKSRQTLLFSATFSDAIRSMANRLLRDPVVIDVSPPSRAAESVRQWVIPVDKKRKAELLMHLISHRQWGQVLVFVKTRRGVDQLVETLNAAGRQAEAIHGDRAQAGRQRALDRFKAGEVQVLVATDVASRGLDIERLPQVVNFDLPLVADDYIHRVGRTGRAGALGEAVSLVCADEVSFLAAIETRLGKALDRVDEAGFAPDHRVPLTNASGVVIKKPKKPKKTKDRSSKLPGNWVGFDADWVDDMPAGPSPGVGNRPKESK